MRKLSIIIALALSLVMVMGISTAFALGEGTGVNGSYTDTVKNSAYSTEQGRNITPKTTSPGWLTEADLRNANRTGLELPARPAGTGEGYSAYTGQQVVHGYFKKNTNSCAACHITHNAAGASLLFRDTVYNTCTACHDGTTAGGKRNVLVDGETMKNNYMTKQDGSLNPYVAGTFRGDVGKGSSMHIATGSLEIKAAPGGNRSTTDTNWTAKFTCSSCHAPHGSYSDRLLHYNPAGVNTRGAVTPVTTSGTTGTNFIAAASFVEATEADKTALKITDVTGTIYVAKVNGTTLVTKPWLNMSQTAIKNGTTNVTSNFDVMYNKSYAVAKAGYTVPAGLTIDVAPATVVKYNFAQAGNPESDVVNYGSKAAISDFCAACHTDYMQNGSASTNSGTFSSAKRHNINKGTFKGMAQSAANMECLSCHFAHGTTAEIMLNADNTFLAAGEKDLNSSSALKRYVNMSVCYRCHVSSKSTVFKQNDAFYSGDTAAINASRQ